MKNTLLVLILMLIVSLFIVGCQSTPEIPDNSNMNNGSADLNGNDDQSDEKSDPKNENDTEVNKDTDPDDINKAEEKEDTDPDDINKTEEKKDEDPKHDSESSENGDTPPADDNTDFLPEFGTAVGDRFIDVTLTTMDGGSVNTADLRGKIVIVNAWASWCPPCKAELPDFDRIATEYKDHVVIIAADVDAGYGGAKAYVDQNFPETSIIFAYDTVHGDAYTSVGGVGYVPHTAIVDQNGVIVYTDSGMLSHSWLVSMIESILSSAE